jgi:hypothetical protein
MEEIGSCKRIAAGTVTEALIEAAEHASELAEVLVLGRVDSPSGDQQWTAFSSAGLNTADANLLVDAYKKWLLDDGG